MNERRTHSLISPVKGEWARVSLALLCSVMVVLGAQAQTTDNDRKQAPEDRNSELRTNTWSIHAQGGLSWATDVWYPNVNAKMSYKLSPAAGGGIDFTIRPWIRVGAEYLWTNYRREQRPTSVDPTAVPIKSYGNYMMHVHSAKLGLGFNLMELWPGRRHQWFNVWIGTGVGYTLARGREYSMLFSTTKTQGGVTTPLVGGETVSNDSELTITGKVLTTNRYEKFDSPYVPASLHIEADVSRRFTLGVKGEMDWFLKRKKITPEHMIYALATVRYNFVASRARVQRAYYEGEITALNDRVNALREEAEAIKMRADQEVKNKTDLQQQNADLEQRLEDCAKDKDRMAQLMHFVQFDNNSSYLTGIEMDRLKVFVNSVKGRKLSLVAEGSTPGDSEYNQRLSERRLERVLEVILKEGFTPEDIKLKSAIGEQGGKAQFEGRRVTITVE